ncbi:MAG TPA: hypothetical protein VK474_11115 [Chthoniobacterales bacterium]|nr:hypothetical protein [Chthoniobacterales bacterium]
MFVVRAGVAAGVGVGVGEGATVFVVCGCVPAGEALASGVTVAVGSGEDCKGVTVAVGRGPGGIVASVCAMTQANGKRRAAARKTTQSTIERKVRFILISIQEE